MRTPSRKATIIFVGILLLFLLSFVSAELDKRDPQEEPPKEPADGGNGKQPADGGNAKQPADGGNGKQPADGGNAKQPADDGNAKQPAAGGKQPATKQPTAGSNPVNGTDVPPPYDPLMPTVQVLITEPKVAKDILYKIGANITFEWKYSSSFYIKPKYIMVKAQPSINLKSFFTIANITVNETQHVVWNTAAEGTLPMSKYKLLISDEGGMDAIPKAGALQPFSNLIFGLYQSQDYEPFSCPSCSNVATSNQIIPLFNTIGLTLITIMSLSFILI
ncbi:9032_t:CDS:2 [Funneliformis geosporum]|uniref:18454_t:CDS:1 n=1 Tax=Funneliformis geosporum TaxID=1117311 RepID=A0A9W4SP34_9GLOM|nr:9032_t:CDS:2 [Funneliformis geosporum]CAI2175672.1 18454_t:CDS:2 [Funneliformis geosporum]